MRKYIVFEGIDCSGKSTQIELLKPHFPHAIFTKEPYDNGIRELALHGDYDNFAQAYLFLADRAKHAKEILHRDALIISDRSMISGIAYATSLDFKCALSINKAISPVPNFVFMFKTNENILQERLHYKQKDNIESQNLQHLLHIQARILQTIEILRCEYGIIDSSLCVDDIHNAILSTMKRIV